MAVFRILPYANMEGTTHLIPEERYGAIFQDLYPRSFLWPQLPEGGDWRVRVPCLITWAANIALPLQSALFSVVLVDGGWRWATVQGVAWTLVVVYAALLASTAMVHSYWRDRKTGLIWDPPVHRRRGGPGHQQQRARRLPRHRAPRHPRRAAVGPAPPRGRQAGLLGLGPT